MYKNNSRDSRKLKGITPSKPSTVTRPIRRYILNTI